MSGGGPRIGHLLSPSGPHAGGFHLANTAIVEHLFERSEMRWRVCVAAGRRARQEGRTWRARARYGRAQVRTLPVPVRLAADGSSGLAGRLAAAGLFGGLDLLHVHGVPIMPAFSPQRTVLTLFDLSHLAGFEDEARITGWLQRAARTVHTVVTSSSFSRAEICRLLGVAPQRVHEVPLGVDHNLFRPQSESARSAADDYPYVLIMGGSTRRKNLERAIRGVAGAVDAGRRPLRLVVTGLPSGSEGERHARRVAGDAGVERLLDLPGYVDRQQLPRLLGGAVMLLYPSLYEGFGLPVLEAMACGTPVVTSSISSLPEVAGDAALLVDPYDTARIAEAVGRVATDEPLRARMRALGIAHAATYSWDRTTERLLRVYDGALAGTGP